MLPAMPSPGRAIRSALSTLGVLVLAACASGREPPRGVAWPSPSSPTMRPPERREPVRPATAVELNADSLKSLAWSPFGRAETGWEIYLPMVAAEIGAAPVPQGVEFVRALSAWQRAHRLPADGVFDAATFVRLRDELQMRRPFLRERTEARRTGALCPDPPDELTLEWTTPAESWGARQNRARPGTLAAWRRMRAAAAADGALESRLSLQVFSGFRSPEATAEACATPGACDGLRRASCSAHRTGLALDLVLDGVRPVDSTVDIERLRLSRSTTYRWMLLNARRFGFVNYPFEPWHWEWTGEPVAPPPSAGVQYAPAASPPLVSAPVPPVSDPTRPLEATDLLPPDLGPR